MAVRSQKGRSNKPQHPTPAEIGRLGNRTRNTAILAPLAICAIIALCWYIPRLTGLNFLPARQPAEWIIYPTPANADALPIVELTTEFRRTFSLPGPVSNATLLARGFKTLVVRINGEQLPPPLNHDTDWKSVEEFDLSRLIRPGTNELFVTVSSAKGLPSLWLSLRAGEFALVSDESWTASFAGGTWQNAQRATGPLAIRPGNRLYSHERPLASLRRNWPFLLLLAMLAAAIVVAGKKLPPSKLELVCIAILALAWIGLGINNLRQLPKDIGFDAAEHLAYIQYILDHGTLPLANQGWEMYQPPLYYLISAGLLKMAHLSTGDTGVMVLRAFGLLCGITTFVLAFLSLRKLFATRSAPQIIGLVFAALLPVNLYLYQYVTNELLAATLVAAALYLCLRMVSTNGSPRLRQYALLGLVLGAALLTKSSALVAAPVILAVLAWHEWRSRALRPVRWILHLCVLLLVCVGVCGWHYYRMAVHFGNPLLGNWDPQSGFNWWQQPGYRTAAAFGHFGQCLTRPFYSAFAGVPDGLYSTIWGDGLFGGGADWRVRPPWNYELMAAGYLFALVPTIAVIIGVLIFLREVWHRPTLGVLLLLGVAIVAVIALAYYALMVPSYAAAKAFYILPALVPLCAFGAAGLELLGQKAGKYNCVVYFVFTVWALNAYASFWIRREAPETRILIARTLAAQNQPDAAVAEIKGLLDNDPRNGAALQLLAIECAQSNRVAEASSLARQAVECAPDDADGHLLLGTIFFQQGSVEQAITEAQRAMQLAPDHPKAASSLFAWLYRSGRKQEAAAACAESLRVDPFNPQFHAGMARVLHDLGDQTNAVQHAKIAEGLRRGAIKH